MSIEPHERLGSAPRPITFEELMSDAQQRGYTTAEVLAMKLGWNLAVEALRRGRRPATSKDA